MGFYLDIVLIAILLAAIIINFIRGILKAIKPFRKWAAIAIAWMIKAPFATLLSSFINLDGFKSGIYDRAYSMWGARINEIAASGEAGSVESYSDVFGFIENILSGIREACVEAVNSGIQDVAHTVSVFISENIVNFIFQIIAFIVCAIVIYLLLTLALFITNIICKKTALNMVNRILGGVLGGIGGMVTVWLISIILFFILPELVEASSFALWLTKNFFLSRFFGIG